MGRKIDRFDKYMKAKGLNDNKVTVQLGLSVGVLGKSRKEGRDLSSKTVEKILDHYRDINRVWLLTGEGNMFVSSKTVDYPENIIGNPVVSDLKARYDAGELSLDEISIRLLGALERRDVEYSKQTERMDKLIELLGKIHGIENDD